MTAFHLHHEHECTFGDVLDGRSSCPDNCTLYAIFDGDKPLYAGRSVNPPARVCQHLPWMTGFGHHPERTVTAARSWVVRFYDPAACRRLIDAANLPSFDRAIATGNWNYAMKLTEPFLIRHLRPALNRHYNGRD